MINQNLLDSLIELGEIKPINKKYFTDRLYAIIVEHANEIAFQKSKGSDSVISDLDEDLSIQMEKIEELESEIKDLKNTIEDMWEYPEALEEFAKDPFGDDLEIATKIGNLHMYAMLEDCHTLSDFEEVKNECFIKHCISLPTLGYKPEKEKKKVVKPVNKYDDL